MGRSLSSAMAGLLLNDGLVLEEFKVMAGVWEFPVYAPRRRVFSSACVSGVCIFYVAAGRESFVRCHRPRYGNQAIGRFGSGSDIVHTPQNQDALGRYRTGRPSSTEREDRD